MTQSENIVLNDLQITINGINFPQSVLANLEKLITSAFQQFTGHDYVFQNYHCKLFQKESNQSDLINIKIIFTHKTKKGQLVLDSILVYPNLEDSNQFEFLSSPEVYD